LGTLLGDTLITTPPQAMIACCHVLVPPKSASLTIDAAANCAVVRIMITPLAQQSIAIGARFHVVISAKQVIFSNRKTVGVITAILTFFLRTVRTCLILCIGTTMGTVCLFANVAGIAYPQVEACPTNDATTIRTCERACATFTFTSNPKHPEASIACLSLPNFLHFTAVKTLLHIRGFVPGILSDECLEYLVTHPPPV
jgi:hypothetical protein